MTQVYDTEFLRRFGRRITKLHKEQEFSQEQLADVTNLHRTYIGFVKQGIKKSQREQHIQNRKDVGKEPTESLNHFLK